MSKIFVARDLTGLVNSWKKSSDYCFIVILNKNQQQGIIKFLQHDHSWASFKLLLRHIIELFMESNIVCSRLEPGTGGSGNFLVPGYSCIFG